MDSVVVGMLISTGSAIAGGIITMLLPRAKTIGLGKLAYKTLGKITFQKDPQAPTTIVNPIINIIRSTGADFCFGYYIAAKSEHVAGEVVDLEEQEYLKGNW